MKNQPQHNKIEEDEIDLRELFTTLYKHKTKILGITLTLTLLATIYALITPKTYEAKAIFEVGKYKQNFNSVALLADTSVLVKELEILFIEVLKEQKERKGWIESVESVKGQNNIFQVLAHGISNEAAIAEIDALSQYVQKNHKKKLTEVKQLIESQIKQKEAYLDLLLNKTLPAIEEKILRYTKDVKLYEANFIKVQENLTKIKEANPTLAALQINEQRYLADMLISLKNGLQKTENDRNEIEVVQLAKLQEELVSLHFLMEDYNYKNTEVVGKIITSDHAIKPKKILIVSVAFVTGFIFSIFFVFFLEFIQGFREEKKEL